MMRAAGSTLRRAEDRALLGGAARQIAYDNLATAGLIYATGSLSTERL